MQKGWENIPAEILAEILSYLHGGMILRCTIICKKWNEICGDDYIWLSVLGKELNYVKKLKKNKNFEINKEIAREWRDEHKESAKSIYIRNRRKNNIPTSQRVFPTFSQKILRN